MSQKDNFGEMLRQKYTPEWEAMLKELFPVAIPLECVWTTKTDIISVLNKIGSKKNLNHTFMPSGGGNDLGVVEESV